MSTGSGVTVKQKSFPGKGSKQNTRPRNVVAKTVKRVRSGASVKWVLKATGRKSGASDQATMPDLSSESRYGGAVEFLGGPSVVRINPGNRLNSPLDVHQMLVQGLPKRSLTFFLRQLPNIEDASVYSALGMSGRTVQRQRASNKPLDPARSSRLWKFADVLAVATKVFGAKEAAEEWLTTSAVGLNGERPIDLMTTPVGAEAVSDLLGRMEYGVYS